MEILPRLLFLLILCVLVRLDLCDTQTINQTTPSPTATTTTIKATTTPINCSIPTHLPNGTFDNRTETTVNSTVVYSCNEGFNMSGNGTVTCMPNGSWSGLPECRLNDCSIPTHLPNGTFDNPTETTVNSTVVYSCNEGFNMSGNGTVTCMPNGSWSGLPECLLNDCGIPTHLPNGTFDNPTETTVNSTVVYSCNEGFNMSGNGTVICMPNGSWSGLPECHLNDCGVPKPLQNGTFNSPTETTVNSTVVYSCDAGFVMNVSGKVTCKPDGFWSELPECTLNYIAYGDECFFTHPNPCVTTNASCTNGSDGMKCKCSENDYHTGGTVGDCVKRLTINYTASGYAVNNPTETTLTLELKIDENVEMVNIEVKPPPADKNSSFNTSNEKGSIVKLTPGISYTLTCRAYISGIPALNTIDLQSYTVPLGLTNGSFSDVQSNSIVFKWLEENNFTDYKVTWSQSGIIEKDNCSKTKGECVFSRDGNTTSLKFVDLTPGLEYTFTLYTLVPRNASSWLECHEPLILSEYTVPLTPIFDLKNSTNHSFVIELIMTNIHFKDWSYQVVYPNGSVTAETTIQSHTVSTVTVSENILSGTRYTVHVYSSVPGHDGNLKNGTIYTRPSGPLTSPVTNITESSFIIHAETADSRFDQWRVTVCHRTNNTCYIIDVNCSDSENTNPLILSYKLTNLSSAQPYDVHVETILITDDGGYLSSVSAKLSSYTAPKAPKHVDIENTDFREIGLDVSGNSQLNFEDFVVEYENKSLTANRNVTMITVNQLIPGTNYTFKVFLKVATLKSLLPKMLVQYTRPEGVSNFTISWRNESSLTVDWNRPEGGVDTYLSSVSCTSPNENSNMLPSYDNVLITTTMSINDLDPGTRCTVTVTTKISNVSGDPVSHSFNETTSETAAENVRALIVQELSSTAVSVAWSPPTVKNGVIRGYFAWIKLTENDTCTVRKYKCSDCPDDQGLSTAVVNLTPPNELLCNITAETMQSFTMNTFNFDWSVKNLHPNRKYSFHVVPYTVEYGDVNETSLQTKEDLPGVPIRLTNGPVSHNSIDLVWGAPYERNGVITNYTVQYEYNIRTCDGPGLPTSGSYAVNFDPENAIQNITLNQSDIYPAWNYNISVLAVNKIGDGQPSPKIALTTSAFYPEPVRIFIVNGISNMSVNVKWVKPCHENGALTNYTIILNNTDVHYDESPLIQTYVINADKQSKDISDLLPYRNYTVYMTANNVAGKGEESKNQSFTAHISAPDTPTLVDAYSPSSGSMNVSWERPSNFTGPTRYSVTARDSANNSIEYSCNTANAYWKDELATSCTVTQLDAYWEYDFIVTVVTSLSNKSFQVNSTSVRKRTNEDRPGKVQSLTVTSEQNITRPRKIFVKWNEPAIRDKNGVLTNYNVSLVYNGIVKGTFKTPNNYTISHNFTVEETGHYTVKVAASTAVGVGTEDSRPVVIEPGAPIAVQENNSIPIIKASTSAPVGNSKKEIAVQLPLRDFLCNSQNGILVEWGVVIAEDSKATDPSFNGANKEFKEKKKSIYKKWSDVEDKDTIPPYITSHVKWNPCTTDRSRRKRSTGVTSSLPEVLTFKVGEDGDCSSFTANQYCNGELKPGKTYRVKAFTCTAGGCTETLYSLPISTEKDFTVVIAVTTTATIVLLVIGVAVTVFLKRRQAACFGKDDENPNISTHRRSIEHEMKPKKSGFRPGAIKLSDFPTSVDNMHRDSNLLFADAYKMLREDVPAQSVSVAESQACRSKNRYTNILPYDHSRVKLRPLDDVEGSDFINANYIAGYTSKREYIAAQGPMQATFDDFWRMIWEQNVDTIVMLTKLVEKGRIKCDKYWPDSSDPVFYGDLVVSTQSESNLADYTLRIFEIKLKSERRIVRHFAYLKWPDMGCPDDPSMLLAFVKTVQEHRKPDARSEGPMVVHCSAGVGRTGTFIAVDYLLQHIRDHDEVDIYNLVKEMRKNRCNMVQTEDQYVYIHECLKAFITTGDEDEDDEDPVYENTQFGEENVYENTAFSAEM